MICERFYETLDGELHRRAVVQTELTMLEQVEPNVWARRLRRW